MPRVFEEMRDQTHVRTFTDLLKVVENELGWCQSWDDPRPAWKVRSTEVSKLKAVIKKLERENPSLKGEFTVKNLLVAVEYLKRRREHIKSPVYLAYALERALEWHHEHQVSDLEERQQRALAQVRAHLEGEERDRWTRMLNRARGDALVELIRDWETRWGRA